MSISLSRKPVLLLAILAAFAGFGCAGSAETEREDQEGESAGAVGLTEKYERQFNPADYDPSLTRIEQLAKADTIGRAGDIKPTETVPPEAIPGFRIQVLSTTEIDIANALKSELSTLPETVGIYIIYDSPYYKVRVGDFLYRPEANQLLKSLLDRGYKDAWIVADRVLKNPRPRKPVQPQAKPPE
ncbi:MAG: SPOR domain-containing protein [Bacteroidota bacterium]